MMPRTFTDTTRRQLAITAAALLIAALVALVAAGAAQAGTVFPRVIGGNKVSGANYAARYPWMVSLQSRNDDSPPLHSQGHFCGGSLIAASYVLTAAHCVVNGPDVTKPDTLNVLVGTSSLETGGSLVHVTEIYPDPQYDQTNFGEHDVAVLKLETPQAGPFVSPVGAADTSLWGAGLGKATDPNGPYVAGWGIRWLDPVFGPYGGFVTPADLTEAAIPIVSDSQCRDGGAQGGVGWGRYFDANTMMCVGQLSTDTPVPDTQVNGITACFGDSGGPLIVWDAANSVYKQAGVVSFGPNNCADRFNTGVFTRVDGERSHITAAEGTPPAPPRKTDAVDTHITGDAIVGGTIGCAPGSWSGTNITYSYQWYRSPITDTSIDFIQELGDSITVFHRTVDRKIAGRRIGPDDEAAANGYVKLVGSTGSTYALTGADKGHAMLCAVTASNASWSTYWLAGSEPVIQTGISGSAASTTVKLVSAKCSGKSCLITVRLVGHGAAGIVRVGGFGVRDVKSQALFGAQTGEVEWRLEHVRAKGKWHAYIWGWDDTGRRTRTLVASYKG